jgi:glycosyltransferase involved in cell wall biosynthesis
MKILHLVSHLGGGAGSVIMGWLGINSSNNHTIYCLDYANPKSILWAKENDIEMAWQQPPWMLKAWITEADIVLVHYWRHPMLADLLAYPLPPCRLVFWCHNNREYTPEELAFPDLWIDTSPVQGHGRYIWSSGGVDRFLEIKPKPHKGFNIGYVGTVDRKKIHPQFIPMCLKIAESIPNVHFTVIGENDRFTAGADNKNLFTFVGKVDDVAPYLAEMDVFGYPLRPDHYGTCEQVIGEAMAAGVVPVLMDNPAEREIGYAVKDEQQYCDTIYALYKNPDRRRRLSDNCRKTAKELYSIDTMISRWNDVFEDMMEQPKRSRKELR